MNRFRFMSIERRRLASANGSRKRLDDNVVGLVRLGDGSGRIYDR